MPLRRKGAPFGEDPLVRQGLVLAAVNLTGVLEGLDAGKSITELVVEAEGTEAQVLAVYDEPTVEPWSNLKRDTARGCQPLRKM